MSKNSTETVKVMVRIRPMNNSELGMGCKSVVKVYKETNLIELSRPASDGPCKDFSYDAVYDTNS